MFCSLEGCTFYYLHKAPIYFLADLLKLKYYKKIIVSTAYELQEISLMRKLYDMCPFKKFDLNTVSQTKLR